MSLSFRSMEIPVAPPKCTTTTDELAETLKCKERCKTAGITVSEYLINNYEHCNPISCDINDTYKRYPPTTTSFDENFNTNPATMVPLRNSSFNYLPKDNNVKEPHPPHELRIHPYGMVDDEELKKVRRRIKNKISAQESRRRKKEYMDSLELRLTQKDQEKELLKNRVTELEEKVRLLVDDLFSVKQNNSSSLIEAKLRHQDAILELTQPRHIMQTTRATQTGTCLQCFRRSQGPWRNGAQQHSSLKTDDESDNGVVPNLTMATDEMDDASNMADMDDDDEDDEDDDDDDSDEKTESADVDVLSLSPTSSSSMMVPMVESDGINMMMKQHSPHISSHHSPSSSRHSSSRNSPTNSHQSSLNSRHSPISAHQSPINTRQSPIENRQYPIDNRNSPMDNQQSPIDSRQCLINKRNASIDTRQSLCDIRQTPINTRQSPVDNRQSPINNRQSPMNNRNMQIFTEQSPMDSHESPSPMESTMINKVNMDEINHMEEGEYHDDELEQQQTITMDQGTVRQEEQSMYPKDPITTQQESLISQLMHTNHLVSPSI